MKKLSIIFLAVLILIVFFVLKNKFLFSRKIKIEEKKATDTIKRNTVFIKKNPSTTIFIPYWQLDKKSINENNLIGQYERLVYFGLNLGERGIIEDYGLKNLNNFSADYKSQWLNIKVDEVIEEKIQQKIAGEIVDLAKNYNFSGIVLDLEISNLAVTDLVSQINNFVQEFYTKAKQNYIQLAVALPADSFYRKRPYDISFINNTCDEIMLMAYDFSKSYGEPGPNFPYEKKDRYPYDLKTAIGDFLKFVPAEKMTVIFGMYGYRWQVDEKKRPIAKAQALSLNEIKKKFIGDDGRCLLPSCLIERDKVSKEMEINYTISAPQADSEGIYRIDYYVLWFEDEESVKIKKEYLREKGIISFAYWAWGYF